MEIATDPLRVGTWTLSCAHPGALAAVPDALIQVLDLGGEALAAWALHNDEQQGMRDDAYRDELRELGPAALAQVVELPRPWQANVVWVDRFHLVVAAAPPAVGSRLLGLYVGSPGSIVLALHHPSVAALVQQHVASLTEGQGRDWDIPAAVQNVRFIMRASPQAPGSLELRAPQSMALPVQDALGRLAQLVAHW
jgi:hypothetical protein